MGCLNLPIEYYIGNRSKYDYVNDAIGRRTSMAKSGTAFTQSDTISYGYNDRSEVTSATAANDTTYNFGFTFDNIGNRSVSTDGQGSRSYTSNNLNQYTAITNPTNSPTYDNDGNMLTSGDWTYTWNGENRLIQAVNGMTTIEFKYDYKGRRVEKKVTENSAVTKHEYFVYDEYELIEVLNALDSSSVRQKFVWGDGLVSVTDGSNVYYYFCNSNQNVGQLIDSSGNIVAKYEYSPFGKLTVSSGNYTDNPFRFSTEYYDTETGLVYYNFRYYSPELGRWTKRDLIEEIGGYNLYGMLDNNLINLWDKNGLKCCGGKKMKEGEKCCGDEKNGTAYYPKKQCCNDDKKLVNRKVCVINIRMGHNVSAESLIKKYKPNSRGQRDCFGVCKSKSINDAWGEKYPHAYVPNSARTDDYIHPWIDENDNRTSVTESFNSELAAAKEEAKKMCSKDCCSKVQIRVYSLDSAGKQWLKATKKKVGTYNPETNKYDNVRRITIKNESYNEGSVVYTETCNK